ncbi:MAG TPA: (2Fe-2S)-binding protein [Marinagarivorans sp.]
MSDKQSAVQFYVNDNPVSASADDADMALVDYLHERQNLTGTKFCCGIGICRACTVAVRNQQSAPLEKLLSCSTPLSAISGRRVYTVESLAPNSHLTPLQQAFLKHFAFQCGYCTPGFLMAATALLEHLMITQVKESQLDGLIEQWVGGNICRCTGYIRYIEAIREVALPIVRGVKPPSAVSLPRSTSEVGRG